MKTITLLVVSFLLTITAVWANDDEFQLAQESALSWLSLTDRDHFELSWNNASTHFQAAISESSWTHSVNAARSSLGAVNAREAASATFSRVLPGSPAGEYVVIQFDTVFENRPAATETVTMMKGEDDVWRVAGYFIK